MEKEAKTQAILLEMVGDLPDADIRPPENVLFVCKLNPVTTDEDLEIIFSRFGSIKSCEIIRDWKTGDSLCYAFIEFEKQEDCEKAYFKMDNVLIDDRRIHVDFSQSVAKIKWKGKGGKYTKDDFKAYEKDLENRSKLALKDQVKPKQDSKYDLLIEDEEATSHRHAVKKHKKRHHHHSDNEDSRRSKKHKVISLYCTFSAFSIVSKCFKPTQQHRNTVLCSPYYSYKDVVDSSAVSATVISDFTAVRCYYLKVTGNHRITFFFKILYVAMHAVYCAKNQKLC